MSCRLRCCGRLAVEEGPGSASLPIQKGPAGISTGRSGQVPAAAGRPTLGAPPRRGRTDIRRPEREASFAGINASGAGFVLASETRRSKGGEPIDSRSRHCRLRRLRVDPRARESRAGPEAEPLRRQEPLCRQGRQPLRRQEPLCGQEPVRREESVRREEPLRGQEPLRRQEEVAAGGSIGPGLARVGSAPEPLTRRTV